MIASFDVFDTVLTRKVGSPQSSFLILGRKLKRLDLVKCSPESFSLIRSDSEKRAFDKAGGLDSDVSLEKIYQEVGYALRLSVEQTQEIQKMEEMLETKLLHPLPVTLNAITDAREKGHQILFISDMYMKSEFIRNRLESFNIFMEDDRLYVSNYYSKSKKTGSLYVEVVSQEKIDRNDLVHCGNDLWSDVAAPQKLGLRVSPFLEGNLNRYEKIMEAFAWRSEGLSSVMAGASRLARLSIINVADREKSLRDVSAGVASPLLIGFTLWVLKRAQSLGLKRLYFLSRDGQILVEIANRLIEKMNLSIEIIYLYGSRQAWLLPSLTTINERTLKGIVNLETEVDYLSPKILFARFYISQDEIKVGVLEQIGIFSQDWNRNLNFAEREKLFNYILNNPEIESLILFKAAERRDVLLQYLNQVRLTEDDYFGVVDLGTGATLHNALAAVLETRNLNPPKSFYLGLRNIPDSKYGLPESYMFDARQNLGFTNSPGLITFLEAVCSGDHGSVIDYEVKGKIVRPILKEEANQTVLNWGYPIVRDTILAFTNYLLLDESLINPDGEVRAMSESLLQAFWLSPTEKEAHAWGSFPMEDGWGKEAELLVLAPPYSVADMLGLCWHLIRYKKLPQRRHLWKYAAFRRSAVWIRTPFDILEGVRPIWKRISSKLELYAKIRSL